MQFSFSILVANSAPPHQRRLSGDISKRSCAWGCAIGVGRLCVVAAVVWGVHQCVGSHWVLARVACWSLSRASPSAVRLVRRTLPLGCPRERERLSGPRILCLAVWVAEGLFRAVWFFF
uniref:Uncharacterized protein n=1 Tax=Knipowitschia caucasica TaxID=637954 RepID=A0AAV2M0R2_KNICA